ncbi:MAG: TolC family protein [Elusimicrobia bacterium]|nr:TolC family protein [Elusimicrobiota bacterium]
MKTKAAKTLTCLLGVVLLGTGLWGGSAGASENILTMDLSLAIEKALASSEDLLIGQNNIRKSEAEYRREKSAIYPQINGTASLSHYFEYPASAAVNDYAADLGVSVEQLLWSFGKVRAAISAQDKYMEVSRSNTEATRQAVIYNTKVSYYSVLLAERSYEILSQSLKNAQENRDILTERSSTGRISRRDLIKAGADVAGRQPLINEAETMRHTALQAFRVVTGLDPQQQVVLTDVSDGRPEDVDGPQMFSLMESREPTLQALTKAVELQKDVVRVKQASFLPEISGFASWNHKGLDSSHRLNSSALDDYGVVGVKVLVPFWTGGFLRQDLQAARVDQENAELTLQKTRESYALALDQALAAYRDLTKTLEANEEAVRLSQESFELTQDFFKTGSATLTDLNDAELQLTQQLLNRENTRYNIQVSLAKIEQLTRTGQRP